MTPSPLPRMDSVQTIDFADAIARLTAQLGEEVRLHLKFRGTFGSCVVEGRLTHIHRLPPDYSAVDVLVDDRQSLMLDPIDTEVLLAEKSDDATWWLEFHLPSGVVASIERLWFPSDRGQQDHARDSGWRRRRCERRVRWRS